MIHLATAFDKNYLNQFYALLCSIVKNKNTSRVELHCIATGVTDTTKKQIIDFASAYNTGVHFYEIDTAMVSRFVTTGSWTMAVYYRLFFPFLVPSGLDRLLYLDSDTIVLKDIDQLYYHDLQSFPVAAIYDNYVKHQPLIGITEEGKYFNSGVLLIDIKRWKAEKISEKTFDYLDKYPEHIRFVDQCALNAVLKDNWLHLPFRYNCMYTYIPEGMSWKERSIFIEDKVILHFTLQRPWHFLSKNPYKSLYFSYLNYFPGVRSKAVQDFSWDKMPSYLILKFMDMYNGSRIVKNLWRKLKSFT